ncbi:hypothetical protein ACP70R_003468 [Stipagrostis hirtigluma subsp. patula]
MEMALRPQGPPGPRSRPALVVRPAAGVGGGSLAQSFSFLWTSRFARSRIIRCAEANADSPNRKSSRTETPMMKVTAFRGYAPRLTVESITKKKEHQDSEEEAIDTYNRTLSTEAAEWTGTREVETAEIDLLQDASSSSTLGEVDMVQEAGLDIFEGDLPNELSYISIGESIDEAEAGEDKYEVDLSGIALSSAAVEDEAEAGEDKYEVDLSGIVLSSAAVEELGAMDEAKAKEDIFVVDLSGIAPNGAAVGEVVDEAVTEEDKVEVDLSGFTSSDATTGKVDAVDEAGAVQETFGVDLSGNASSSETYAEVHVVGENQAEEVILEMDMSETASSSANLGEVNVVNDTMVEKGTLEMDVLSSASGTAKYRDLEPAEETFAEDENDQQRFAALSSTSMQYKSVDKTPESLMAEAMPVVVVQEQDSLVFGVDEEEGSINDFHEEGQPIVDFQNQEQNVISFVAFDEENKSTAELPEQDPSVADFPEQKHDIVGSPKQDVSFSEQNKAVFGSYNQDQSTFGSHEQGQSIHGSHGQAKSIAGVPEQISSVLDSSKPDQSIVSFRKEHQSIVLFPEQKQSIVGFQKQDLSIVGISRESQTKQLAIVGSHDAHAKGGEAKDGDYTFQKADGDTSHVKFDVKKHKEDISEEAVYMTTSKKVLGKRDAMIEEKKSLSVDEEQQIVTEEGTAAADVEMGMAGDEVPLLSEEESSWAEDQVGIIEDEEQYEVDDTSISAERDIQEIPQDDVDPQALHMMLQELAEKNYSLGHKLFVFPEVVKADSTIDLYLNRDLSALANEPDVLIKGAFNGWRWRLFTERLHKSELGGVWWSCKLYIPKQAYRLDFVFFNGRTVYENNGNNDFVIQIESTMDEELFEDFLVEEKQKELERLAIEEAERKSKTEEQRRREQERAADESDKAQAKAEVQMKKNNLRSVLGLAKAHVDNFWYIEPSTNRRGATVRLYYNRHSRPLLRSTEIWMHGGFNNWTDGLSFAERLVQRGGEDGAWWYADVIIPERAFVLDWVFADGPPGNARNYDNNDRKDFHSILPNVVSEEEYWVKEEQRIYTRLLQERREREEVIKRKAERGAKMKAEMKEKTMRMFLVSQKHIVYTEPLEIRAGTTVDVHYNPSNTVLIGKPEVWLTCSFNRWMHQGGVLPPQRMVKTEDGSHLKATVNVPPDAYMMDFVFSESEEGGIYDNRNGLDYHIPVFGSIAKEPPLHIVQIAVEMAPVAKVGGLGDVVTSLSRAVQDLGHNVEVILPKYDCLNLSNVKNLHVHQSFSWGGTEIKVWFGQVEDLPVYFLEPQNGELSLSQMFGVGCVYGRNDDRRFGFFCHSALEFLLQRGSSPHIIHCHDWSSAPVAWLFKEHYAESNLANARVVFTIHNLEFGAHYIGKAMRFCDKATTVSNTYSREVSGHGAIAPHRGKFYGILNGIDPDIWDPYTDNFIPVHYTSESVVEGKSAAKKALQQKLGLQQNDVPIVGIVTRLTAQKGIHLIKHAIHRTLERNGQVVLLGSAPDGRVQNDFRNLANTLHGVNYGRVRMCLTYDEPLSHLIYAGSDFIIVPSIFEPCGLTQLVAMRYGTIPIVRKTGGLYDTVFDVDHDKDRARARGLEPNGFSFDGADSNGVDYALNRAISAWFDSRSWFQSLCKRVMEQDWSWNRPALDYIELYLSARKF